jgi:hypothetical protein
MCNALEKGAERVKILLLAVALSSTSIVAAGASFHFTTAVQTPKGNKSASGTIVVKQTGPGKVALTITTSDGSSRTIALVASGGTLKPNPAQTAPSSADAQSQAAAQALLSNIKLAAAVGMATRQNGGKTFKVPVTLTPVGQGTPVPANLTMKAYTTNHGAAYAGEVEQTTMTHLPPSGGIDPAQLEKSVGVNVAAAGAGVTPAGRAAMAIAMHHRAQEQKQAANGPLVDTISLSITSHFAAGRFHDISGVQTDSLQIGGKPVTITSTWSFTKSP